MGCVVVWEEMKKKRKIKKTVHELSPKKKRKKKKKIRKDVDLIAEWIGLRILQRDTACSHRSLHQVADNIGIHRRIRKQADRILLEKSGAEVLQLNGCTNCHKFVWKPSNNSTRCPECGGPRFEADQKTPLERAFYFPITTQLRNLLKLKSFRDLLQYEYKRVCNPKFLSDVFDSPVWQQVAGPVKKVLSRILLHY